jgi:hypothetical protein
MKSKTEKIKAKGKAVKAKLVAKLKGAAKAGAACLLLAALCGCQSTPSRSQTQTIRDCTFYVMLPAGSVVPTNAASIAESPEAQSAGTIGDLFCQAMMIENSGSESLAPQHTISPTTDLSYGVGTGGGSTWGELFSGMKSLFSGGTATGTTGGTAASATATPSAASASAAGNCADGSCTTPK